MAFAYQLVKFWAFKMVLVFYFPPLVNMVTILVFASKGPPKMGFLFKVDCLVNFKQKNGPNMQNDWMAGKIKQRFCPKQHTCIQIQLFMFVALGISLLEYESHKCKPGSKFKLIHFLDSYPIFQILHL